jgi:NAD(P)-dependent dehydrogenase (short-subunit alcohol dehydrogenase family)
MPAFEAVTFDTIDYDKFDFMMAVNAKGPMKVSAAFIDHVAASDQKKIVTMASGEGSIGRVRQGGAYQYRASKAALNMLMRNMSFEVADRGVIIGLLSPGLVDTNGFMTVDLDTLPEEARMPIEMMRKSTVRTPMESATLMVPIIEGMTLEDSGVFNHVTGRIMPW